MEVDTKWETIAEYDKGRLIEHFKSDAIAEWDRLVGHLPTFGTFISFYVNQRWAEMIRRN